MFSKTPVDTEWNIKLEKSATYLLKKSNFELFLHSELSERIALQFTQ